MLTISIRVLTLFFILTSLAFAKTTGIGHLAGSFLSPVAFINDFIETAALCIGFGCLLGAILKYMQHRVNPLETPTSTVVLLFLLGLFLCLLPLLSKWASWGVPYGSSTKSTYTRNTN